MWKGKKEGVKIHQNAGRLQGRIFVLDIFVLGDSSKFTNKNGFQQALIQEMEINDKITQVIDVRLDQVVMSETEIGNGKNTRLPLLIEIPDWLSGWKNKSFVLRTSCDFTKDSSNSYTPTYPPDGQEPINIISTDQTHSL